MDDESTIRIHFEIVIFEFLNLNIVFQIVIYNYNYDNSDNSDNSDN
jgi:hypothetical protein